MVKKESDLKDEIYEILKRLEELFMAFATKHKIEVRLNMIFRLKDAKGFEKTIEIFSYLYLPNDSEVTGSSPTLTEAEWVLLKECLLSDAVKPEDSSYFELFKKIEAALPRGDHDPEEDTI
jgi:hypothetical protein